MNTTVQSQDRVQQPWLLPRSFTVRLDMLSDWHVGSGTGRPGSVDRLIARDSNGLPYIPAKTLTGIWRDALERLTTALDDGEAEGQWAAWTDVLFGSQPALARGAHTEAPRPAALEISPAQLLEGLRMRLVGQERTVLRQALTFVKPGVAIDSQRGQARPEYLRFEEMARIGTVLEAACILGLPEHNDQQAAASALLLASAQLIEHLGGKRRRGAGRCRLAILGHQASEALQWLQSHAQPPALPAKAQRQLAGSGGPATAAIQPSTTGAWLAIPISLHVQTPLAVAARTLGNVTETLDYVPGTLLLPHVTRVLRDLGYGDCQAAVAAGMLQILPATLDLHGVRGLPVPQVLFQHKMGGGFDHPGTIVNRLLEALPDQAQTKGLRVGYIGAWGDHQLPPYDRVPQVLLTHNTVEDEVQRPTSDVGGVYSREAIASGVLLRTELRLPPSVDKALQEHHPTWWEQLNGPCRLGLSRKDDYGLVQLTVQGPPRPPQSLASTLLLDLERTQRLTVWHLSDVLLRDYALRPAVASDCLRDALEARLNVKLKAVEPAAQYLRELLQVHRIESWHTRWGQPRPSLVAIAAGSCALFDIDEPLDQAQRSEVEARLREIEATGIGERRGEGYGQLCFNATLLTSPLRNWAAAGQSAQGASGQQMSDTSVPAGFPVATEK